MFKLCQATNKNNLFFRICNICQPYKFFISYNPLNLNEYACLYLIFCPLCWFLALIEIPSNWQPQKLGLSIEEGGQLRKWTVVSLTAGGSVFLPKAPLKGDRADSFGTGDWSSTRPALATAWHRTGSCILVLWKAGWARTHDIPSGFRPILCYTGVWGCLNWGFPFRVTFLIFTAMSC